MSLKLIGTWPEQTFLTRCLIQIVVSANVISIMIPEIVYVKTTWFDVEVFLEWVPTFTILFISFIQLVNLSFHSKNFRSILDHICSDWERFSDSPNIEILHKYGARGCWITKTYLGWMYAACLCYVVMPLTMPVILESFQPTDSKDPNRTKELIYLYNANYGVNSDDYYYIIFGHMFFESWVTIISVLSNDVMYFTCVEHACALFEIVGENLKRIRGNETPADDSKEDINYKIICHCIDLHKEAIIFTSLIDSSYSACLLVVIGGSLILLSVTGLQVLMYRDELGQLIRFGSYSIAQIFHLYLNSIPGQKIMDHSLSIFDYAYSVDWHNLTPKAQKLIILMMIRSLRPCQITAGKMYIVTMENYSAVMQTSMSFFTVLSSMQ
uniref:Odorant receptor n=1 Tax=Campoletis chlorideae TaxID=219166 RepID=A0A346D437_9HYME|nr:odorant receptor [Campoletis chlorideae]